MTHGGDTGVPDCSKDQDAFKQSESMLRGAALDELLSLGVVNLEPVVAYPEEISLWDELSLDQDARCGTQIEINGENAVASKLIKEGASGSFPQYNVFSIGGHPGAFFVPAALSVEEQILLAGECLWRYTTSPNRTNVDKQILDSSNEPSVVKRTMWPDCGNLKHFRWSTIGNHYNWTERRYSDTGGNTEPESQRRTNNLPTALQVLCQNLVTAVTEACNVRTDENLNVRSKRECISAETGDRKVDHATNVIGDAVATPEWWEDFRRCTSFRPDSAIMNLYKRADRLRGHIDDAEEDKTSPLVAVSLGQAAIFLLGGTARGEQPVPILLRSGDVLLLGGSARQAYHGIACLLMFNASNERSRCVRSKCGRQTRNMKGCSNDITENRETVTVSRGAASEIDADKPSDTLRRKVSIAIRKRLIAAVSPIWSGDSSNTCSTTQCGATRSNDGENNERPQQWIRHLWFAKQLASSISQDKNRMRLEVNEQSVTAEESKEKIEVGNFDDILSILDLFQSTRMNVSMRQRWRVDL